MIKVILMLILIFAPMARGSVSPIAYCSMQLVTLLAVSLWLFSMFRQGEIRLKRTQLDIPALLFIALAAVSIIRAEYKYASMVEFLKLLNIAAVFCLVINNIEEKRDIERITSLIVILGAGFSLFGIIQYFGGITNFWWHQKKFISSVYVNHNHFSGFLELCIPLCLGIILYERKTEKKLFYGYLLVIMLTAFIFSMSRGAWFSLAISFTAMFALLYKRREIGPRFFIALLIIMAAGFFIIHSINLKLFVSRLASYRDLDFSGRLEIWRGALKIIKDNLFSGTGLGMFTYYFPEYRPVGLNMFVNYAHNDYLQVSAEMGISGLLCMAYIIFLILKKGFLTYFVARSNFKKFITLGAVIGILSIAIHSMADFNLNIPANAALFAVLAGIIFSLRSGNEGKQEYFTLKLNKMFLSCMRPVLGAAIFVSALFIARIFIAEAVCLNINKHDFDGKTAILNKAIKILPEKTDYYKKLAQLYMSHSYVGLNKEGDLLMALSGYSRAIEINPRDAWAWAGKGDACLYLNFFEEAECAYKNALILDPNNSYYLKRYGNLLAIKGELPFSVDAFKNSSRMERQRVSRVTISYDASDPQIYMEKGKSCYKEGDFKNALNMYRIAEGLSPEDESIKIKIIDILERTGYAAEAEKYASLIKQDDSVKVSILNSKARYLISRGLYQEADRLVEDIFNMDGNNLAALQSRIDILQRRKMPFSAARPYMESLMKLNKGFEESTLSGKNIALTFNFGKNGVLKASGSKIINFALPIGAVKARLVVSGVSANNEWPHMLVKMNSMNMLSKYVESSSDLEFNAAGIAGEGSNQIEIEFSNDYWDSVTHENRILNIKKLILEYIYPDYEN